MINFTIKPDPGFGDEFEVTATSRDIYMWEKTSKGRTFTVLMNDMSMVDMFRIAYFAAARQKLWSENEASFTANVDLTFSEADEVDPTNPVRSREISSR